MGGVGEGGWVAQLCQANVVPSLPKYKSSDATGCVAIFHVLGFDTFHSNAIRKLTKEVWLPSLQAMCAESKVMKVSSREEE